MSCMCTRVKKGLSAFTLIELLIVVAIIAILAAIAVPNFLEAQTRAKVSRVQSDFRSLATAIEAYTVDYDQPPICPQLYSWEGAYLPLNQVQTASNIYQYVTHPLELFYPLSTPNAYITTVNMIDPFRGDINTNTTSSMERNYLFTNITTGYNVIHTLTWCGLSIGTDATRFYAGKGTDSFMCGTAVAPNPVVSCPYQYCFNQDVDRKYAATWSIQGCGPDRNYRDVKWSARNNPPASQYIVMPWDTWVDTAYVGWYDTTGVAHGSDQSFYDSSNGTKSMGNMWRFSGGSDNNH
jgi:prepilin-type N-terminal cleavage/methylation domain-containing protein